MANWAMETAKVFPGLTPSPGISSWAYSSAAPPQQEPCPPTKIYSTPSPGVSTAQTCRSGARSLSSSARTWWPGLSISLRAGRMKSRERQSRFRPSRKLPRIASKPGETYLPGCNAGSATAYSVKPMVPPPRPRPAAQPGRDRGGRRRDHRGCPPGARQGIVRWRPGADRCGHSRARERGRDPVSSHGPVAHSGTALDDRGLSPAMTRHPGPVGRLFAWGYDRAMAGPERALVGRERQQLLAAARGRVLDVGAGTGANLGHYRQDRISALVLVDPSAAMLERARRKAARLASARTWFATPTPRYRLPSRSSTPTTSMRLPCRAASSMSIAAWSSLPTMRPSWPA